LKGLKKKAPGDWSTYIPRCDPTALDLLKRMLQFSPEKRITVKDAIKHPFFNLYDCSTDPAIFLYLLFFQWELALQPSWLLL
jgi:serine/threonine protein kinase